MLKAVRLALAKSAESVSEPPEGAPLGDDGRPLACLVATRAIMVGGRRIAAGEAFAADDVTALDLLREGCVEPGDPATRKRFGRRERRAWREPSRWPQIRA